MSKFRKHMIKSCNQLNKIQDDFFPTDELLIQNLKEIEKELIEIDKRKKQQH